MRGSKHHFLFAQGEHLDYFILQCLSSEVVAWEHLHHINIEGFKPYLVIRPVLNYIDIILY